MDAASANHRVPSKAELCLLNYSAVIKAVKSPWCAEVDISIDYYPTENTKGKPISLQRFHSRALHVRQLSIRATVTEVPRVQDNSPQRLRLS